MGAVSNRAKENGYVAFASEFQIVVRRLQRYAFAGATL